MTARLSEGALRELLEAEAKMTPGDFVVSDYLDDGRLGLLTLDNEIVVGHGGVNGLVNAGGLCLARNALRSLVEEVQAGRAAIRAAADTNGGPIDKEDTSTGRHDYVMVRRDAFDALMAHLSPAPEERGK